jgi:hypothetical protein
VKSASAGASAATSANVTPSTGTTTPANLTTLVPTPTTSATLALPSVTSTTTTTTTTASSSVVPAPPVKPVVFAADRVLSLELPGSFVESLLRLALRDTNAKLAAVSGGVTASTSAAAATVEAVTLTTLSQHEPALVLLLAMQRAFMLALAECAIDTAQAPPAGVADDDARRAASSALFSRGLATVQQYVGMLTSSSEVAVRNALKIVDSTCECCWFGCGCALIACARDVQQTSLQSIKC